MKVLYVTSSYPFGSVEPFVEAELRALGALGHEVTVFPIRPKGPLRTNVPGTLPETYVAPSRAAMGLSALGRLARLHRWGAFSPRGALKLVKNLVASAQLRAVQDLVEALAIDHIHAYWASTPATVAMLAAEAARRPWSFTAHRWDIGEDNLLATKAARACFTRFISEAGLAEARPYGVEASSNTPVIHVGVDLPDGAAEPSTGDGPFTVLTLASLIERKGHRYLFAAARELRESGVDLRLDLAGDGPEREALEALSRQLGLESVVTFRGNVPHDQMLSELRAGRYHAVALPSLHEGIPVSIMEAMAAGVPCVATDVGGSAELLRDGAGLIVPPRDSAALRDALRRLAARAEVRASCARLGRARIEESFSATAVATALSARFEACSTARALL